MIIDRMVTSLITSDSNNDNAIHKNNHNYNVNKHTNHSLFPLFAFDTPPTRSDRFSDLCSCDHRRPSLVRNDDFGFPVSTSMNSLRPPISTWLLIATACFTL